MENSELGKIAENYMQIWNAGQDDLLEKWADDDLKVSYTHFEKPLNGVEEYRRVLNQTFWSFPDLRITVEEVNVCDGSAVVKWTYTGTHLNGNLFGVEPNGQKVKVSGLSILHIREGKVVREYGIVDNLSLVIQLGALKM
ncbi:ester cyclase [Dyadobacter sp. 676]|uniref:Ester cyclase n=1 Tax=Dyadobacter sp. 676 TaxID=3088362 RepID=A0AAU8FJM6_9BACT